MEKPAERSGSFQRVFREKVSERIISRILFRFPVTRKTAMIIPLRRPLPTALSDTTREHWSGQPRSPIRSCSGWGLPSFPGHPGNWWALTSPFHPYPSRWGGGIFSVALSL